tara:strand:- start:1349 stop:2728 length:1380 start_codon:yes stop_codon:yes gene_type:complete
MINYLDKYFKIYERKSSIFNEVKSGTIAFLTMSYIITLNPQILEKGGYDKSYTIFATIFVTCASTFLCGVLANIPFGIAPGLGLSTFVAYNLAENDSMDIGEIQFICFCSGVLVLFCTITRIVTLTEYVPNSLKHSIVVGMGLLISMIGYENIKLITYDEITLNKLNVINLNIVISLCGLCLLTILSYYNIYGRNLLIVILISIIIWIINNDFPDKFYEIPDLSNLKNKINFDNISNTKFIIPTLIMSIVLILDISGVILSLEHILNLETYENNIDRINYKQEYVYICVALGTIGISFLGCSPVIVHLESIAGIKAGGKTGLSSVITSLLFGTSIFILPIIEKIPLYATTPVLILIGSLMIGNVRNIDWDDYSISIPSYILIITMPFSLSIPNGIIFGFIFYIIINVSIYLIDCFISKYSKNEEIVSENIEPEYVRIPNEIVQENLDIKPNEFTNDFEP